MLLSAFCILDITMVVAVHGYGDNNYLPATCIAMQVHGVCQPIVIIAQGMTVGTCSVTSHSQPHLSPKLEIPFLTAKNKKQKHYAVHSTLELVVNSTYTIAHN
ncbi:hypothetical protein DFP73DRAFT_299501 [Morchella snyderi]|nr:hypothetical protein DFP73DRAFT_299501 [Morchella snyderi]